MRVAWVGRGEEGWSGEVVVVVVVGAGGVVVVVVVVEVVVVDCESSWRRRELVRVSIRVSMSSSVTKGRVRSRISWVAG